MPTKRRKLIGVYSGYQDAEDDPRRITEDLECDAVILSVWAVQDDGTDTIKAGASLFEDDGQQEVYWGFGNACVHPLYPPDTTDYIYVDNVKDIFIRANKQKGTATRVGFSCFKYVEKEIE